MSKEQTVIDLKKVMNDVIKLSKQKKMTGKGLFDKCWWQHNFNHSNMSQQCKNEYANASMRKQLLGFGKKSKKHMKGGAFNAYTGQLRTALINTLQGYNISPAEMHTLRFFVIPSSQQIMQNIQQLNQEQKQMVSEHIENFQQLELENQFDNIDERFDEILELLNAAQPQLTLEESRGGKLKSKKHMRGGAFDALPDDIARQFTNAVYQFYIRDESDIPIENIHDTLEHFIFPSSYQIKRHIALQNINYLNYILAVIDYLMWNELEPDINPRMMQVQNMINERFEEIEEERQEMSVGYLSD